MALHVMSCPLGLPIGLSRCGAGALMRYPVFAFVSPLLVEEMEE